ncbi:MAG: alpha-glycosidase [Clostridia bacterium]|nr:alpha-glycosidase [Clostridia bacterium]
MFIEAIEHANDSVYAHAIDERTIVLRLRAKKGDLKECVLFYGDRACFVEPVIMDGIKMELAASDLLYDYFEVELKCQYTRVCYYFWLSDGITSTFYYGYEFHDKVDCHRSEYFQFAFLRREEIADVPGWLKESVIYQIFPDSFATAERYISGKESCQETVDGEICKGRLGGTLRGVTANIPYMQELGINCIYINPIFPGNNYHKYDTIDYFSIDPCFGSKEDFKEMVSKCHEAGIKVILDGVFNHSGAGFFAFKDVLEKGENSKYKDWFYRLEFPVQFYDKPNYDCFAYEKHMPKLNTGNPEVIDYFTKVGVYWIKEADIDGWRLDVANEIDHDFWRSFRKAVRAVRPDAALIGEVWEDAQSWLCGDQFDSTMNYRFTHLCDRFFAKRQISVEAFDGKVNAMLMRYRKNLLYGQMNLLDSHDVPRFLSKCGGDIRRQKLAALFQMMFTGTPSVYYGDEKGMSGWEEPEYRAPMVWQDDAYASDVFEYYKKLIRIRKENFAPLMGAYRTLVKDNAGSTYAFERRKDDKSLVVALNNSDFEREIEIPVGNGVTRITDLFEGNDCSVRDSVVKVKLQPMKGTVLRVDY